MAKKNEMVINGWEIVHNCQYWEVLVDDIYHMFNKYDTAKKWIENNLPPKNQYVTPTKAEE